MSINPHHVRLAHEAMLKEFTGRRWSAKLLDNAATRMKALIYKLAEQEDPLIYEKVITVNWDARRNPGEHDCFVTFTVNEVSAPIGIGSHWL